MSHFASRVLKRFGDTDRAHEAYLERAAQCNPPLPDKELGTIWKSALKFSGTKSKAAKAMSRQMNMTTRLAII